jgi:hypothetical protein
MSTLFSNLLLIGCLGGFFEFAPHAYRAICKLGLCYATERGLCGVAARSLTNRLEHPR